MKILAFLGTRKFNNSLQEPATCPYTKADLSSLWPLTEHPNDASLYYPPIYTWVFLTVLFPQVSPLKPSVNIYFPSQHATCLAQLIILDLINRKLIVTEYSSLSSSLFSFLHTHVRTIYSPEQPIRINFKLFSSCDMDDQN